MPTGHLSARNKQAVGCIPVLSLSETGEGVKIIWDSEWNKEM